MKPLFIFFSTVILVAMLAGCSSDGSPFTEGGNQSSGPISDKNFNLFFDEVNPAVIDDNGAHGGVQVVITVFAGDKFNASVNGGTVRIQTEWGILDSNTCQLIQGSCTVNWTSDSDFAFIPLDLLNTFTAYIVGEESYVDLNGSGNFDNGDTPNPGDSYLRDLEEPYLDLDHNGSYTAGFDEIIDIDNNGVHTLGDNFFNGANCTHSTLCAPNKSSITIFDIGTINLDARDSTAPALSITIDTPANNSSFTIGANINFTATATDPEDLVIIGTNNPQAGNNIVWVSDIDGILTGNSNSININTLSQNTHTITVTVTDSDGNTAEDIIAINITP